MARLGFIAVLTPEYIDIKVDPQRDNALTATVVDVPGNGERDRIRHDDLGGADRRQP